MGTAGLGGGCRFLHSRIGNRKRRGSVPPLGPKHQGLHPSLRCKIKWNIASTAFTCMWTHTGCSPESVGRGTGGLYTFHWPQGSLRTTEITATLSRKKLYAFFLQQKKCKRTNYLRRWVEVLADSYFTEEFKIIYNIRKPWPSSVFIFFAITEDNFNMCSVTHSSFKMTEVLSFKKL